MDAIDAILNDIVGEVGKSGGCTINYTTFQDLVFRFSPTIKDEADLKTWALQNGLSYDKKVIKERSKERTVLKFYSSH